VNIPGIYTPLAVLASRLSESVIRQGHQTLDSNSTMTWRLFITTSMNPVSEPMQIQQLANNTGTVPHLSEMRPRFVMLPHLKRSRLLLAVSFADNCLLTFGRSSITRRPNLRRLQGPNVSLSRIPGSRIGSQADIMMPSCVPHLEHPGLPNNVRAKSQGQEAGPGSQFHLS
jgi:hypothetical protein